MDNITLISGDVRETLSEFLGNHPEWRFNCVNIDVDVYEPTRCVLEQTWPFVVKGGIVMLDDYNMVGGATKAIDEFLERHPGLEIKKLPWSHIPAFITKPV